MKIPDCARRRPLGWSAAGALVALLCQPLAAGAQASAPASQPPGLQPSPLGTGTAPAQPDASIPEPATKTAAPSTASGPPLNDARANFAPNDPPGEWHSQARDYANTRYSPLDQITAANVAQLQRRLDAFPTARQNGHEARAARRRRHDVPGDAVPEHRLRARPDQARRADQVVATRRNPSPAGDRQGLLRRGQPRLAPTPTAS